MQLNIYFIVASLCPSMLDSGRSKLRPLCCQEDDNVQREKGDLEVVVLGLKEVTFEGMYF